MPRKARNIESANYSEFSRRHGSDVPFYSMKYTIVIGAHVESTNYSEFSRRHGSDVPFYSMKCTIANGVHVAALNRPSPRADLTGPIVTLLKQNPHSPSSLTANIGRYYGLISPSKSFYWRAVGLQHGAMGAHPIRIGLEKEKIRGHTNPIRFQVAHYRPNRYLLGNLMPHRGSCSQYIGLVGI